MDRKGRATDNAHIERLFRTIKFEMIYLESSETGRERHDVCTQFIQYYNENRGYASIGDITPLKDFQADCIC